VRYWGPMQQASVCLRACVCEFIRHLGFVQLHVAAVSSGKDTVMLFGPKGRGKTSTSVALHNAGWTLHAEDNAWVRPETLEAICGDRTLRFHAESMAFLGVNPRRTQFDPVRGKYAFDVGELQRFEPRFQPNRFVYILPQRSGGHSGLHAMSRRDFVLTFLSGQGIPLLEAGRRSLSTFMTSAQRHGSFHSLVLGDPPVTLAADAFEP
jgi:hypothetical protein